MKRIREQEGLSYGIGGSCDAHPIDKVASFNEFAIFAPENRDRLEDAFREEIQKIVTEGFNSLDATEPKCQLTCI